MKKQIQKISKALQVAEAEQVRIETKITDLDNLISVLHTQRDAALIALCEADGDKAEVDAIERQVGEQEQRRRGLALIEDRAANTVRDLRGELAHLEQLHGEALAEHVRQREADYQLQITATAAERVQSLAERFVTLQMEQGDVLIDAVRNTALAEELMKFRTTYNAALEQSGRRNVKPGGGYYGFPVSLNPLTMEPNNLEEWHHNADDRARQFAAEFAE